MKHTLIILSLFTPFAVAGQYTSAPPIIAYDNCELDPVYQWGGDRTKVWTYWTGADHILPGSSNTASMTRNSNYVRKGNYSYQARITKDLSYNPNSNTARSEMVFSNGDQPPLGWRWAAVSMYIPDDFCVENSPMTIAFNTKAVPDDYPTPFRLDTRNGRYYAVRADIGTKGPVTGEVATDIGPIDKGQWVDWVYNRNFTRKSDGYQRLYKNGVLVWSHNGPNWVTGGNRAPEGYMQQGLYKWPWLSANGEGWGPTACNNPIEVYYDEYKFGNESATLQSFQISTSPEPPPGPPVIVNPIADQSAAFNSSSKQVSLFNVFSDDEGAGNITLSINGNSNTSLIPTTSISGTTLTLTIANGQSGNSTITVRATDSDGLFVEDQFVLTVQTALASSILINSGGAAFTYNSENWAADKNFSGGRTYSYGSAAVAGTSNDVLYQTERFGNFTYTVPVTNGSYIVVLHFAEMSHTQSNKRSFNVNIENGQGSLTSYDIFVKAGGYRTAKTEQFIINVTDGNLNIGFVSVKNNATVSGIQITSNSGSRVMNTSSPTTLVQRTTDVNSYPTNIVTPSAYPNPFTDRVTVSFKVAEPARVKMEIVNSAGQVVAKYAEEPLTRGVWYRKEFIKGQHLPGIYFYRIRTDMGELKTGKIIMQ